MKYFFLIVLMLLPLSSRAQEVSGLDQKIKEIFIPEARRLAALPEVIAAVKAANLAKKNPLTNRQWKLLPVSHRAVQELLNNRAAQAVNRVRADYVAEFVISSARGQNVAVSDKTSFFNRLHDPKHALPMKGQNWRGKPEFDLSSGVNQIKVSVPVMSDNKPIGSFVLGAAIAKI